jgi:hypothetical protein
MSSPAAVVVVEDARKRGCEEGAAVDLPVKKNKTEAAAEFKTADEVLLHERCPESKSEMNVDVLSVRLDFPRSVFRSHQAARAAAAQPTWDLSCVSCDLCQGLFYAEEVPLMLCIHVGDGGKVYCLPCLRRKETPPCPCLEYHHTRCGHTKLWVPQNDLELCAFCGRDSVPSHLSGSQTRWSEVMCCKGFCDAAAGCRFKAPVECLHCHRTFCPRHLVQRQGQTWCVDCNREAGEVTH